MLRKLALVLLPACLGASSVLAQGSFNQPRLDSLLTSFEANHRAMGSLTLSQDGKVVYSRAFGQEQAGVPATAATRYRIGSISKLFTATMLMQLVEEGKLKLDAPLATWFPQLPNATRITVDQLLHHRSGLHSFTSDAAYATYMAKPQTQAQMLAIMSKPAPDFEPGAKFEYSNTNYLLLGYIIEKVTGQPYKQVLQKRITSKLGLKETYYGGPIDAKKHEAASFRWSGSAWQPEPETDMSIPGGAGALVSTPTDLTRFIEGLFGGRLVKPATLEQMMVLQDGYGAALMPIPFGTKKGYGHGGVIDAFQSSLIYFPTDKLALAYCQNGSNFPLNDVLIGALSSYYGTPYRLPDLRPATPVALTATDLGPLTGTYTSTQMPLKVTVTAAGNTLLAQATGQQALSLTAKSKTQFTFEPAGIVVDFDADRHTFTLQQGGKSYLFTRE
ncbi:serine hydrolase domain-containing protein [Hymenobacter terrestris]|uniref:Beta-lactamase family protein n=1 Tax=Hymenobacter terrestris TaxID=2748310 RepID=A0ABX2PY03_9BACT|nr:serine hydrolase domain-containing protein [Hymenobacter terrestris]NVO83541.1 beta-lactamase family protein [Hymenobacter terrestris]